MPTEKFDILNRISGAVMFSAEITCSPNDLPSVKLGFAVKAAVAAKADLRGADLGGADLRGADLRRADLVGAHLGGADLGGAHLRWAHLRWAYLGGADLRGADLRGADLRGADLGGAHLGGAKILRLVARATRLIESYEFFGLELEGGGYKIMAGCRWFTDAKFRAHVASEYPDTDKARETLAILDFIKARAEAAGVAAPAITEDAK